MRLGFCLAQVRKIRLISGVVGSERRGSGRIVGDSETIQRLAVPPLTVGVPLARKSASRAEIVPLPNPPHPSTSRKGLRSSLYAPPQLCYNPNIKQTTPLS